MQQDLTKLASGVIEIGPTHVIEEIETKSLLSQEDFDADPSWAEGGYAVGDEVIEWIAIGEQEIFEWPTSEN